MKRWCALIFAACHAAGCQKEAPETATRYSVRGIIREISPDRHEVTIKHDNIPGFMDAMTMEYRVKSPNILDGRKIGEEILFQLDVSPSDFYVEKIAPVNPKR